MASSRRLDVLRTSQHFGPGEWPDGARVLGETGEHWGERACGVACVRSVVHFHTGLAPDLYALLRRGVDAGGFGGRGWDHASLAALGRPYGIDGESLGMDGLSELFDQVDAGLPVIVSCTLGFPEDGRRGGHLVLVTGHRPSHDGDDEIDVMDPSRRGRTETTVRASRLATSWTGRAIVFRREGTA